MELRTYQKREIKAVMESFMKGQNALIVAATGTGKTIAISDVTRRLVAAGHKVLILAHRGELLEQTQEKLSRFGVDSVIEKASSYASLDDQVVVGSIQSIMRQDRLERFPKDHFGCIIVDECHHIMSDSYQRVIEYFKTTDEKGNVTKRALIFGVTATPNRSDMKSLSKVFPEVSYAYKMRDAINDGYLVPINVRRCPISISLVGVRTSAGDYLASDLEDALEPYIEKIGETLRTYAEGRKTLIFTPTIAIGEKIAESLCSMGFSAAHVAGVSKDRDEIKVKFHTGEINVLCNSMLLTEGYDEPSVDCIINLRATKSKSLFTQIVGRGMRLSPETGKENLLYLDFLWENNSEEKPITPANILIDEETRRYMEDGDLDEEINIFELEEMLQERRLQAEIALAERLRAAARTRLLPDGTIFEELNNDEARNKLVYLYDEVNGNLVLQSIVIKDDPFIDFLFGEDFRWDPVFANEMLPPTERQYEVLKSSGFRDYGLVQFKGQASRIIETLFSRKDVGLVSFKQYNMLTKKGFVDVEKWHRESAQAVVTDIANNGWKIPKQYWPVKRYKPAKFVNIEEHEHER